MCEKPIVSINSKRINVRFIKNLMRKLYRRKVKSVRQVNASFHFSFKCIMKFYLFQFSLLENEQFFKSL